MFAKSPPVSSSIQGAKNHHIRMDLLTLHHRHQLKCCWPIPHFHCTSIQLLGNWWFGFRLDPRQWKGLLLRGTPKILNHQFSMSWSIRSPTKTFLLLCRPKKMSHLKVTATCKTHCSSFLQCIPITDVLHTACLGVGLLSSHAWKFYLCHSQLSEMLRAPH